MKRKMIGVVLTCLLSVSLILSSCSNSTTTFTTSSTTASKPTSTSTSTLTSTWIVVSTTKTSSVVTTTSGNWWDKLGVPQYGGEMVLRVNKTIVTWDPYFGGSTSSIMQGWLEKLHADDWTLDPAIFDYKIMFRPPEYVKGSLAESWEMPDASTYVVHLRKGIHWQDIPPVNGREFTADDVVWHYNRFTGMGSGFTKPSPYYLSNAIITAMTAVTAVDKYTVSFKFKQANTEVIIETLQGPANQNLLEAREAVEKWGDIQDWHHAIGTGPFI